MSEHMTVREFSKRFLNGDFDSNDVKVQIEAGWYDWFCKDGSLRNKTIVIGNIIKQLQDGGKVDLDKSYVFFKNNCPGGYGLYDEFKFCDMETGQVQIVVDINAYDYERFAVFGRFPEGEFWSMPYEEFARSKDLVKWLNMKQDEYDVKKAAAMQVRQIASDNEAYAYVSSNDEGFVAELTFYHGADEERLIKELSQMKGFDMTVQRMNGCAKVIFKERGE